MMAARDTGFVAGELLYGEPLARHTSWRVGGPARRFYQASDMHDLARFLAALPSAEPLLWLGLGSNLLVRDGGFHGTVIATQRPLSRLEQRDATTWYAAAGVPCAKLARHTARAGLTGAEFLAGIPGTVGGALAMNAGAYGGSTWERVVAVETMDRGGVLRTRDPADFHIGYRSVQGPPDEWFIAGHFRLPPGTRADSEARIKTLLAQRNRTQPTRQANSGSVFRNPPGDHAARLIEAAGLKGLRRGGASVSDRHANFIINDGTAHAADIEALIGEVQQRVERQFGVRLHLEVHIVGLP